LLKELLVGGRVECEVEAGVEKNVTSSWIAETLNWMIVMCVETLFFSV
jgi:hypothetical protein